MLTFNRNALNLASVLTLKIFDPYAHQFWRVEKSGFVLFEDCYWLPSFAHFEVHDFLRQVLQCVAQLRPG